MESNHKPIKKNGVYLLICHVWLGLVPGYNFVRDYTLMVLGRWSWYISGLQLHKSDVLEGPFCIIFPLFQRDRKHYLENLSNQRTLFIFILN